jgi:2-polyprenyl-3-methyl-5-hydroxy-6-metoxy-1,4-benzoquinol methylase
MPFLDEAFDACLATEVVEHILDVQAFIREIHRMIARDGLFLLTTPYHGWLKNVIIITRNFHRHFDPTGDHIRFFSKSSLTCCLTAGGFRVETVRGIGRVWPVWKSMFVVARRTD